MKLHNSGKGHRAQVLLHGIPGSAAIWDEVIPLLSPDRLILTPDLVGFGASRRTQDFNDLWAWKQAEALAESLDSAGVKKVSLIGHDFGGPVGLSFVALFPQRVESITLIACNAFGDTPIPFPLSGIFWPVVGPIWQRMLFSSSSLKLMVRNGRGRRSRDIDIGKYVTDKDQAKAVAVIFSQALRRLAELYEPFPAILRGLQIPRQVIWGTEDPFFSVEQAHRTALLAGAELKLIQGGGHFLPSERPEEIASLIKFF